MHLSSVSSGSTSCEIVRVESNTAADESGDHAIARRGNRS